MNIEETGEVVNAVRLPDPNEAEAFEVDMPTTEPVKAEDVNWVGDGNKVDA